MTSRRAFLSASLGIGAAVAAACKRASSIALSSDAGPEVAKRVVSISASTTEALFAVGAGAQVVGRSRYCDFPPEALKLPAVGGFIDPNLEAVLALSPDLVVGARSPGGAAFVRTLDQRGIATWFPPTERFDAIVAMLEGMGARTGHIDESTRLTASLRRRREAIVTALSSRPRPRVLMIFSSDSVSVAGPGSFCDEMIALAGATNAVTSGDAYPMMSLENVVALDPEWILDARMRGDGPPAPALDGAWRAVRAVGNGHVARVDDERVLRSGPRVLEGVAVIARAIHPDVDLP